MEATEVTTQMTFRCSPLPELEVPMINTMVTCHDGDVSRQRTQKVELHYRAVGFRRHETRQ